MRRLRHSRRGFTLIELLIVVVIIGVLAAIAVPKFRDTKGKSFAASLKSDLRNLATAEEAYFYENNAYTANLASLNLSLTSGVTITFGAATAAGWSALNASDGLSHPVRHVPGQRSAAGPGHRGRPARLPVAIPAIPPAASGL